MSSSSSSSSFCSSILTLNGHWINSANGGLDLFHFLTVIPTCFFVLYLMSKLRMSIIILKHSQSLVLSTVYTFVWCICVFNLMTSLFSMTLMTISNQLSNSSSFINNNDMNNNNNNHSLSFMTNMNRIVGHVSLGILNFVIEFIEIAVIVFMFFSHSQLSHIKVVTRTGFISGMISLFDNSIAVTLSLLFFQNFSSSTTTPGLIIDNNNNNGNGVNNNTNWMNSHIMIENALYTVISTSIFVFMYTMILLLPLFKCIRHRIPQRSGFYIYIMFLTLNNMLQLIGGALLLARVDSGLCVMTFSKFLYFSSYAPILYKCFLSQYFTRDVFDQVSVERFFQRGDLK